VRELDSIAKMPVEDNLSFLLEEQEGNLKRTKKLEYQQGYDGEITSMSFNHVVKDKMFKPTTYASEEYRKLLEMEMKSNSDLIHKATQPKKFR